MTATIDYTSEDAVSTLFDTDFTDDLHLYLGLDPTLDSSDQPVSVDDLLHDAIHIVEGDQWRNILNKDVLLQIPYDAFCATDNKIYLPFGTVNSVTTFTYIDSDGDEQTLTEGTDYTLYTQEPAFCWADNWWDVVTDLTTDNPVAAEITYTTGYSSFSEIPRGTLRALKIMCYYIFNNRGLDDVQVPMAYRHQCMQAMANNRRALEYV